MSEIKQIENTIKPAETFLVADSLTGQVAASVAKEFKNTVNLSGIILTRADGDARGGAAVSMKFISQVPIKFLGIGEKIENLEIFHPDRIANRILGMGDIVSLVEKAAQEQLKSLGEQNNILKLPIIEGQQPTDICRRAISAANLNGADIILFDTAGRTQIDLQMMSEIKQIAVSYTHLTLPTNA